MGPSATASGSEPKRHHFVPKFYLRQFADHKRRIRMYRRGAKTQPIVTSVNNAAVESGLYTVTEESGQQSQRIERSLSLVEAQAKDAMERLIKRAFPPDAADRYAISFFMALQLLRTPESRRQHEVMVDHTQKVMLEGWTPDYARERLENVGIEATDEAIGEIMDVVNNPDRYRIVPHQNEHIRLMLTVALEIAPVIHDRAWLLGKSNSSAFITSDHPVVTWTKPTAENEFLGVGVGNAEEVHLPLGRNHVLMLAPPGSLPERVISLDPEHTLFVNSLEAQSSHRWVYQHPSDDPIGFLIPETSRPLAYINGKPVFDA